MTISNESHPVLIGQSGPLNGSRWVVRQAIIVGRGEDCDIVISDRKISRKHAIITPSGEGVLVEDLKSKNGTHLNGKLIKGKAMLKDGDQIQIALAQNFTFLSSDATIPLSFELPEMEMQNSKALELDRRSRRVWVKGVELSPSLSAAQFTLLEALFKAEGSIVPREKLVRKIWNEEEAYSVSDQALDALVRRLRDRLASIDEQHHYVVTVRGHGLRLENPVRK